MANVDRPAPAGQDIHGPDKGLRALVGRYVADKESEERRTFEARRIVRTQPAGRMNRRALVGRTRIESHEVLAGCIRDAHELRGIAHHGWKKHIPPQPVTPPIEFGHGLEIKIMHGNHAWPGAPECADGARVEFEGGAGPLHQARQQARLREDVQWLRLDEGQDMHIDILAPQGLGQFLPCPCRRQRDTEPCPPDQLFQQEERIARDSRDDVRRLEQKIDEHRWHGWPLLLGHCSAPAADTDFA